MTHLRRIGTWTLGTVTFLAVLSPLTLDAKKDQDPLKPQIDTPALKVDGCELTLQLLEPAKATGMKPGSQPTVNLVAYNSSNEQRHCKWSLSMMVTPASSPMMRTIAMPSSVWQEQGEASLNPGERKTITLSTKKPLAAGSTGYFLLASGKQSITPVQFSALTEKGEPSAALVIQHPSQASQPDPTQALPRALDQRFSEVNFELTLNNTISGK